MQLPTYTYKTNDSFLDHEFISDGPKGTIKKVVRFTLLGNKLYNLSFGDLDEKTGQINDLVATNNNDSKTVLATVATIVNEFLLRYPGTRVAAKGSTLSRTRLYKIGIVNHWKDISIGLNVYGLRNGYWEPFERKHDYEAFLVQRK